MSTGHPLGYQRGRAPVVRLGRIVSSDSSVIHTDCTLISGDSGGPLFDLQGEVIGIHSRIARPLTMNFHVPVSTYSDTWDRLAASQQWGGGDGPMIGIRGEDSAGGCLVKEVFNGLPADRAGLKAGDLISKFEGAEVQSLQDLIDEISRHKSGEEVTLEFVRDGQRVLKKLVLIGRNP